MNIQQIKNKYTCLDYLGDSGQRVARGFLFSCPWRQDRHPSLSVTLDGRGWHDLSDGTHGNIIDLIAKTIGSDNFTDICSEADKKLGFPVSQNIKMSCDRERNNLQTFEIVELETITLKNYIRTRNIEPEFAKFHGVKEARYGNYRNIAFPNDKGGYELRGTPTRNNPTGFKGSTSNKGITTYILDIRLPWIVFEGFFDMLSFFTLGNREKRIYPWNYIVMNSVSFVDSTIEALKNTEHDIYLCLDNDKAGNDATEKIISAFPKAIDIRYRFEYFKDVSDYLMWKYPE